MEETIRCTSCGAQNPAGAEVCRECGGGLQQSPRASNDLETGDDGQVRIGPDAPSAEDDECAEIAELGDSARDAVNEDAEGAENEPDLYEIEQEPPDDLAAHDGEDSETLGEHSFGLAAEPEVGPGLAESEPVPADEHTTQSWLEVLNFALTALWGTITLVGSHTARQARIGQAEAAAWWVARRRPDLLESLGRDGLSTDPPVAELAELRERFVEVERRIVEKDEAITAAREEEPGDTLTSQAWHFFAIANKVFGLRLKRRRLRGTRAEICREAGARLIELGERREAFGQAWDRVAELDEEIAAAAERVAQVKAQRPTSLRDVWRRRPPSPTTHDEGSA